MIFISNMKIHSSMIMILFIYFNVLMIYYFVFFFVILEVVMISQMDFELLNYIHIDFNDIQYAKPYY